MANSVTNLRINITASFGSSYVGAGEVRVRDSSGTLISLTRATFTASSTYQYWYPAKLKDGSTAYGSNTWASDGSAFPQWINIAFPSAVDAATVEIVNYELAGTTESIRTGSIVATHTGGSTTSVSFTRPSDEANATTSHTIPPLAATGTDLSGIGINPTPFGAGASNSVTQSAVYGVAPIQVGAGAAYSVTLGAGVGLSPIQLGAGAVGASLDLSGIGVSPLPLGAGAATSVFNAAGLATQAPNMGAGAAQAVTASSGIGVNPVPLGTGAASTFLQVAGIGVSILQLGAGASAPEENAIECAGVGFPILHLGQGAAQIVISVAGRGQAMPPTGAGAVSTSATSTATVHTGTYWLHIDTGPSYRFGADNPGGLSSNRLINIQPVRNPLSMPQLYPAEISNASAELDNGDAALTQAWRDSPPIRTEAALYLGSEKLIQGVITKIGLSNTVQLDIEAGLLAPITDTLPLRSTTAWGEFENAQTLPVVYGRTTVAPIAYDKSGRMFHVADHPIQGIDRVTVDGARYDGWFLHHAEDSAGVTCAFIELSIPITEQNALAVTLRGKMHPTTGALITRSSDVLHDLLVNVAGVQIELSALDKLRSNAYEIELGGAFDDAAMTVKAAIDAIIGSVGGAWSLGAEDAAILDPFADDEERPTRITPKLSNAEGMSMAAQHDDLATVLRITFNHDYAADKPRSVIQLEAHESILEYGRIEKEWAAPLLKSGRQAEILGRRLLSHMARPKWRITWTDATLPPPKPGDFADLSQHPRSGVDGRLRLFAADHDPSSRKTQCACIYATGLTPQIELVKLSEAFEREAAPVEVVYANGVATFTVRSLNGEPLPGASVTLNGKATRITDSSGRVSFATPRGKAMLLIKKQGYADQQVEVTV